MEAGNTAKFLYCTVALSITCYYKTYDSLWEHNDSPEAAGGVYDHIEDLQSRPLILGKGCLSSLSLSLWESVEAVSSLTHSLFLS